jgi:hypothetical protein
MPADLRTTLDAIPVAQVPAAIALLAARLLTPVAPADDLLSAEDAARLLTSA